MINDNLFDQILKFKVNLPLAFYTFKKTNIKDVKTIKICIDKQENKRTISCLFYKPILKL